jgi:UDP-N-acetylmuramate--alanine ligase
MSAIARYFLLLGVEVHGYDKTRTPLTESLENEGVSIHYNEDPSAIPADLDLIVYTPAIPAEHKEWELLIASGVPLKKRAEVLGIISAAKRTIAVAGTHGKTSTSSMTTAFLRSAGVDVTGFLGGIVKDFDSNFVYGESDWVVVEADEFDRSFMHLNPEICVLLSMDADHLDIYGNHEEMLSTFRDFTMNINEGGSLLITNEIKEKITGDWKDALEAKGIRIYEFGINEGHYNSTGLSTRNHAFGFDFNVGSETKFSSEINMPGKHNVSNATGALGICELLECDSKLLAEGVRSFEGIKRRFDFGKKSDDQVYIDDYAHHPSELNVSIQAARDLYPNKKITAVFQPHLFSRTNDFMDDFAEELSRVDELILMEIYPAREKPMIGVTSSVLKSKINKENVPVLSEEEVLEYVGERKAELEVLMTLGAGNIDRLVEPIKSILNN